MSFSSISSTSKSLYPKSIRIGLIDPNIAQTWAQRILSDGTTVASIKKGDTINHTTSQPIATGLFCQRIFGPCIDYTCACGHEKIRIHRNVNVSPPVCPECHVEWTDSSVRRQRLGSIELISPVTHKWFSDSRNYIPILSGITVKTFKGLKECKLFFPFPFFNIADASQPKEVFSKNLETKTRKDQTVKSRNARTTQILQFFEHQGNSYESLPFKDKFFINRKAEKKQFMLCTTSSIRKNYSTYTQASPYFAEEPYFPANALQPLVSPSTRQNSVMLAAPRAKLEQHGGDLLHNGSLAQHSLRMGDSCEAKSEGHREYKRDRRVDSYFPSLKKNKIFPILFQKFRPKSTKHVYTLIDTLQILKKKSNKEIFFLDPVMAQASTNLSNLEGFAKPFGGFIRPEVTLLRTGSEAVREKAMNNKGLDQGKRTPAVLPNAEGVSVLPALPAKEVLGNTIVREQSSHSTALGGPSHNRGVLTVPAPFALNPSAALPAKSPVKRVMSQFKPTALYVGYNYWPNEKKENQVCPVLDLKTTLGAFGAPRVKKETQKKIARYRFIVLNKTNMTNLAFLKSSNIYTKPPVQNKTTSVFGQKVRRVSAKSVLSWEQNSLIPFNFEYICSWGKKQEKISSRSLKKKRKPPFLKNFKPVQKEALIKGKVYFEKGTKTKDFNILWPKKHNIVTTLKNFYGLAFKWPKMSVSIAQHTVIGKQELTKVPFRGALSPQGFAFAQQKSTMTQSSSDIDAKDLPVLREEDPVSLDVVLKESGSLTEDARGVMQGETVREKHSSAGVSVSTHGEADSGWRRLPRATQHRLEAQPRKGKTFPRCEEGQTLSEGAPQATSKSNREPFEYQNWEFNFLPTILLIEKAKKIDAIFKAVENQIEKIQKFKCIGTLKKFPERIGFLSYGDRSLVKPVVSVIPSWSPKKQLLASMPLVTQLNKSNSPLDPNVKSSLYFASQGPKNTKSYVKGSAFRSGETDSCGSDFMETNRGYSCAVVPVRPLLSSCEATHKEGEENKYEGTQTSSFSGFSNTNKETTEIVTKKSFFIHSPTVNTIAALKALKIANVQLKAAINTQNSLLCGDLHHNLNNFKNDQSAEKYTPRWRHYLPYLHSIGSSIPASHEKTVRGQHNATQQEVLPGTRSTSSFNLKTPFIESTGKFSETFKTQRKNFGLSPTNFSSNVLKNSSNRGSFDDIQVLGQHWTDPHFELTSKNCINSYKHHSFPIRPSFTQPEDYRRQFIKFLGSNGLISQTDTPIVKYIPQNSDLNNYKIKKNVTRGITRQGYDVDKDKISTFLGNNRNPWAVSSPLEVYFSEAKSFAKEDRVKKILTQTGGGAIQKFLECTNLNHCVLLLQNDLFEITPRLERSQSARRVLLQILNGTFNELNQTNRLLEKKKSSTRLFSQGEAGSYASCSLHSMCEAREAQPLLAEPYAALPVASQEVPHGSGADIVQQDFASPSTHDSALLPQHREDKTRPPALLSSCKVTSRQKEEEKIYRTSSPFASQNEGAQDKYNIYYRSKIERLEKKYKDLKKEYKAVKKICTDFQNRKNVQKRRYKLAFQLLRTLSNPVGMTLSSVPVLPPGLRPIIDVPKIGPITADLNIRYRGLIFALRNLRELAYVDFRNTGAAQASVQEAVDDLLYTGGKIRKDKAVDRSPNLYKSLAMRLKGKHGRFRGNLLGKRVDYSGRSVIVVGPTLKIHQCGLPFEIATKLFNPFLIRRLIQKGLCKNVYKAKQILLSGKFKPLVWTLCREVMLEHLVLLNRAPTLHRLGVQAFMPILISGRAILLHPLVCTGFNADFDGDQMGVHIPLFPKARAEAWKMMWSRNNFLAPSSGEPILLPSQDMVLGCYYLTEMCLGIKPSYFFRLFYKNRKNGLMLKKKSEALASHMHNKEQVFPNGLSRSIGATHGNASGEDVRECYAEGRREGFGRRWINALWSSAKSAHATNNDGVKFLNKGGAQDTDSTQERFAPKHDPFIASTEVMKLQITTKKTSKRILDWSQRGKSLPLLPTHLVSLVTPIGLRPIWSLWGPPLWQKKTNEKIVNFKPTPLSIPPLLHTAREPVLFVQGEKIYGKQILSMRRAPDASQEIGKEAKKPLEAELLPLGSIPLAPLASRGSNTTLQGETKPLEKGKVVTEQPNSFVTKIGKSLSSKKKNSLLFLTKTEENFCDLFKVLQKKQTFWYLVYKDNIKKSSEYLKKQRKHPSYSRGLPVSLSNEMSQINSYTFSAKPYWSRWDQIDQHGAFDSPKNSILSHEKLLNVKKLSSQVFLDAYNQGSLNLQSIIWVNSFKINSQLMQKQINQNNTNLSDSLNEKIDGDGALIPTLELRVTPYGVAQLLQTVGTKKGFFQNFTLVPFKKDLKTPFENTSIRTTVGRLLFNNVLQKVDLDN